MGARPELSTAHHLSASDRLKGHKERILKAWEAEVRRQAFTAQPQSAPALLDSLPKVLDQIAETLAASSPEDALKPIERQLAHEHGEKHAVAPQYTLDQMIWECHLRRRVLFDVLEDDEPISRRERDIIWDAIFLAVRNSATCFTQLREQGKVTGARTA